MARRVKTRSIKADKSYSVHELAETVEVSDATVRNWIGAGLQSIDASHPTIIMGFQAKDFLAARKVNARRPLALGEFYCFRCKAPRGALGAMADYVPTGEQSGRLEALCEVCECQCNRNISACDLPEICSVLDVANKGNR